MPLPSLGKCAASQEPGQWTKAHRGGPAGLVVPRASRPRAQGTVVHGPELHLRAFVGLWEPVQENAGTGDGGLGWEPPASWGHAGLSNKGFKEHPICPARSQRCWDYSDQQVPFAPDQGKSPRLSQAASGLRLNLSSPPVHPRGE